MKRLKLLGKSLWGGAAVSALTLGVITVPLAPFAGAGEIAGCSYGTGGPNDKALCWIDMSSFGEVSKAELAANPNGITKPLDLTIGNYRFTMNATVTAGKDGAQGIAATGLPTWGGSVMGSTQVGQDYYKNTSGKPALYQITGEDGDGPLERDTVELSNIQVVDTRDNSVVNKGYSLVVADAESTDGGEGFIWKSNSNINEYQQVVPDGWQKPCKGAEQGLGTSEVKCIGGLKDRPGQSRGIIMAKAEAPTKISSSFSNGSLPNPDNPGLGSGGESRQGVAFAVVLTTLTGGVTVNQDGGSNGSFQVDVSTDGQQAGTASSGGGSNSTDPYPVLSGPEGTKATYTASHTGGTVPEGYEKSFRCTVGGEVKEPNVLGRDAQGDPISVQLDVPANQNGNCEYIATAKGPKTGDDKETINPNTTANLAPQSTKGKGDITDAAFDNGEKTKTVTGQGTWTIELVDGQPKATFTPEKDYDGTVDPQNYTITDQYGLKATGKLEVEINKTIATGDDKVVVDQGEPANLAPETTPGTGTVNNAVFDNGETTKVVEGEGKWEIKLENGQPKATFTPADGFTGPVTTQVYTVSDSNGLKASGKLDVIIRPKTGDDDVTVNQGDTAFLTPEAKKGSGKITGATFDNGQSTKEVPGEGTWTIAIVDGQPRAQFEPADGVDGKPFSGPVTAQTYKITDQNGESAEGNLEVFIRPDTGDDSVVVKQGQTAELNPESTPGSAPIVSAAFDNGSETKVVAGEGTWTISVVNGQPVAEFVPDANFNGPVTSQSYTVTDSRGETATGNLSVIVLPETGNDTVIVAQGESATLNPSAKPGSADIVSAHFENGESTLVVPGEGTWKVYVVNGQPEATFVPEAGFTGPVTSQDYTVVDENDEDATGTLNVIIKPETGDDSVTIGVNETANLDPETAPGSGEITKAVFDNGETTKEVPGQGTWTIELVDGQPKATFTPEKDYNGPVDSQKYTVTDENNLTASGTLRVTIRDPKISLVKTANPTIVDKAGEEITYTFKVTNTGNLPLTNVTVDDKDFEGSGKLGEITPASVDLKPNETKEFTAKYTVTQEDIDSGAFKNVATSTGETPEDPNNPGHDPEDPVSPPDDETVTPVQDPKISVTKKADKQKVQKAGEKIVYTFVATNTGNVTLKDVKINDDAEAFTGTGELSEPVCEEGAESLAPGESVNCTADYTVTEDDLKTEKIHNVATATGDAPGDPNDPDNPGPENPVSPPADEDVPTEPVTDVPVVKTVTGPKGNEVQKDDKATFQIKATWKDVLGTEQEQIINVTPGKPVDLKDLPKNTEITLSEVGAETSVSNIKWGDIIWSGAGVTDATGDSPEAKVILEGDGPFAIDLENQTSSNGLIIIPIPIPLPNGGGSSNPPTPNNPDNPSNPSNPDNPSTPGKPSTPQEPGNPGTGEKGNTPGGKGSAESPKKGGGLANTGANVALLAGGAILLLIGGAWLVLRGRKEES